MSSVNMDETLYYQWLINNNSASTMLNAISGSSDDSSYSSLSAISALSGLSQSGDISSLGSLSGLSSLGSLGSTDSVSGFSDILQTYLSQMGTANATTEAEATEVAQMAEKLGDVLEEAGKSEDTSSLTYQTVQEIYEYFSDKVSARASELLGTSQNTEADTASKTESTQKSAQSSYIDQMNEAARKGQEFDFSGIDEEVEAAFAETMPLS